MNAKRYGFILGLIVVIALLHGLGLLFYLYWQLPWYHPLVHTLSGFWVTYVMFTIMNSRLRSRPAYQAVLGGILFSLLVALGWEAFELKTGLTAFGEHGYAADTIRDLISDIIGGTAASLVIVNGRKAPDQQIA